MKISHITVLGNSEVSFGFCCSVCNYRVDSTDKFCRECGRKLEPIAHTITMADACKLLTESMKANNIQPKPEKKPKDKVERVVKDDFSISSAEDESSADISEVEDNCTTTTGCCPRYKNSSQGCEFLHGCECHGVVFPTYPPQYPECVYLKRTN